MVKRFYILCCCLSVYLGLFAQKNSIQHGYVRKIATLSSNEQTLSNAIITVNGNNYGTKVAENHRFSFPMNGHEDGDECIIQKISKKGYSLAGHRYKYSSSTPMWVYVVDNQEQAREKEKIRLNVKKENEKKFIALKKRYDKQIITSKEYEDSIIKLQKLLSEYENAVSRLSDYFTKTNIRFLSDFEKKILMLLDEGKIEDAIRLIDANGGINQILQEYTTQKEGCKLISMTYYLQALRDGDLKTAATVIDKIVNIDPTSIECNLEGGWINFLLANYKQANKFARQASFYASEINSNHYKSECAQLKAVLFVADNDYKSAIKEIKQAIEYYKDLGFNAKSFEDFVNIIFNYTVVDVESVDSVAVDTVAVDFVECETDDSIVVNADSFEYSSNVDEHDFEQTDSLEYDTNDFTTELSTSTLIDSCLTEQDKNDLVELFLTLSQYEGYIGNMSVTQKYMLIANYLCDSSQVNTSMLLKILNILLQNGQYVRIIDLLSNITEDIPFDIVFEYVEGNMNLNTCFFGLTSILVRSFCAIKDGNNAIKYLDKELKLAERINIPTFKVQAWIDAANTYTLTENWNKADSIAKNFALLALFSDTITSQLKAAMVNISGNVNYRQGNYRKAIDCYKLVIEQKDFAQLLPQDASMLYWNLGQNYLKLNRLDSAYYYSKKSLELRETMYRDAEVSGNLYFLENYNQLAQIESLRNNNEAAFDYYEKAYVTAKGIYKDNNSRIVNAKRNWHIVMLNYSKQRKKEQKSFTNKMKKYAYQIVPKADADSVYVGSYYVLSIDDWDIMNDINPYYINTDLSGLIIMAYDPFKKDNLIIVDEPQKYALELSAISEQLKKKLVKKYKATEKQTQN